MNKGMDTTKECYPCDEPVIDKEAPCPLKCKAKCPSYKKKPPEPDLSTKVIIWLIGGPGSGRGTQSQLIVNKYGFTPLSIGRLMRAEIATKCTRAKCLMSVLERGELLPNDVLLDLLKKEILKTASTSKGYVIDGFPREERQGMQFEKNIAPVSLVLYFEASDETLIQRIMAQNKPSLKVCDNTDTVKIRMRKFHEQMRRIVPQYPHRLVKINAERTTEQIFQDVKRAIDEVLQQKQIKDAAKAAKEKKEREEDEAAVARFKVRPALETFKKLEQKPTLPQQVAALAAAKTESASSKPDAKSPAPSATPKATPTPSAHSPKAPSTPKSTSKTHHK